MKGKSEIKFNKKKFGSFDYLKKSYFHTLICENDIDEYLLDEWQTESKHLIEINGSVKIVERQVRFNNEEEIGIAFPEHQTVVSDIEFDLPE